MNLTLVLRKVLLILRDEKDAVVLSKFLKNIQFKVEATLAVLDVSHIPINKVVVNFNQPEWFKDCPSYFEGQEIKVKTIEYNGSVSPAETLTGIIKKEEYDLILVTRRNIVRDAGLDLALAIAGISPVPVMVVPV